MQVAATDRAPVPGGFITIHRHILEWPLYRYLRADQRHVVTTLLFLANWKPSRVWVAGKPFDIDRGELIHTEATIAEEAGCGRQVVRTVLDLLSQDGFVSTRELTSEGTRRVRKITIRNYDRFQSAPDRANPVTNPETNQPLTTRQPLANQRVTPSEPSKPVNQGTTKELRAEKPRATKPEHPRCVPVRDRLTAVFAEAKRAKYGYQGAKDTEAIKRLLAHGDDAEIERRWRVALDVKAGFYVCNSIAVFESRWNDYHAPPSTAGPYTNGAPKKQVTLPPAPHSAFEGGGKVEF